MDPAAGDDEEGVPCVGLEGRDFTENLCEGRRQRVRRIAALFGSESQVPARQRPLDHDGIGGDRRSTPSGVLRCSWPPVPRTRWGLISFGRLPGGKGESRGRPAPEKLMPISSASAVLTNWPKFDRATTMVAFRVSGTGPGRAGSPCGVPGDWQPQDSETGRPRACRCRRWQ
jgi:hypothetical protein